LHVLFLLDVFFAKGLMLMWK